MSDTEVEPNIEEPAIEPFEDEQVRRRLKSLPPSAKLVAKVLAKEPKLSNAQIAEHSMLPKRTVRYALRRLEEEGLVEATYSIHDARKQLYFLDNA